MTKVKTNTTLAQETICQNGSETAVCRAPNGTIWIVYRDTSVVASSDILVAYSTDNGATWTEEVVLADARCVFGGMRIALMVDSLSVPHLIFAGYNAADTFTGRIRYMNRSGGVWGATETIDNADAKTSISAMRACIDSTNTFHIIAKGTFGGVTGAFYWSGVSGTWGARETVDNASVGVGDISVTSANLPVVTYNDAGGIKYNDRTGTVWTNEETISTNTENWSSNKIAVDSSNNIHVVWNQQTGDLVAEVGIKYRKRTSGVWGTELLVADPSESGYGYSHPLFGLDSSGTAYVVYQYEYGYEIPLETVWYRMIVSEVVSSEIVLDSAATMPNNYRSTYAYLWTRYPTSNILSSDASPSCVLLQENGTDADVYFNQRGIESAGIAVINNHLVYTSHIAFRHKILGYMYSASSGLARGNIASVGENLCYVDYSGNNRKVLAAEYVEDSGLQKGNLGIVGNYLVYEDYTGDNRKILGVLY